jgi:hypothetical protein
MSDPTRGTDRGGRRSKRFLTPSQKYEIYLQLVRQEVTMAEAAEAWKVDRTTILRIRTVAKQRSRRLGSVASGPEVRPNAMWSSTRPAPTPPGWAGRSRRWP